MLAMGFATDWVKRITRCVSSVEYRVKINDRVSEKIIPSRGLRQGDPISPYLFLICAEWLTYAIKRCQELGYMRGVRICRGAPIITHLMFADDCILFLKASRDVIPYVSSLLKSYEEISGQKVNLMKSEVVCSKNVQESVRNAIVDRMGMKIVDAHSSYLGLPIIFSNKKVDLFRIIEEKVLRKIGDWKHKLLSYAGREVLIKSILQAIPLYAMSCFKIPLSLCRRLARDLVNFWWNKSKGGGIHWIKAEELYKENGEGGLGFKKIELMNLAMLAKQGWRLMTEPDLLVSKVFKAKYYSDTDLMNASTGARPSYAWRGMMEALEIIKFGAEWDDIDRQYYWRDETGGLTVKGTYKCAVEMERLKDRDRGEQSDTGEIKKFWRNFWRLKIPHKIKMFGWRISHNSLPTMQKLERRGCLVDNRCVHCGMRGETAIHIFKDCWWSRSLLHGLEIPSIVCDNECNDPVYWLWLAAKFCSEREFIRLLYGLWVCWLDRNNLVHGKEGRGVEHWVVRVEWMIRDLQGRAVIGGWGVVVIADGRVDRVRAGWLNRASSVLEVECLAIEKGMEMAQELRVTKAKLLTDSRNALWALNLGMWRPNANLECLRRCIKFLDEHQGWTLDCCLREDIMAADWLARKSQSEKWEWISAMAVPRARGMPNPL
ncbi:hypothetical protein QQ045_004520 [Rhodiola kirilowii]